MKLPNYNQRLLTMEKRTRRFMLGAVAVMLLVLVMIAAKQDYFSRSTAIYFFTPNAQGLSKGMAVKFVGFKVGSVRNITMEPNATVRVKVSLDDEYVHLIGQDAKARLVKEALVGESVVEIIPGSQQVRQVVPDSVLEFERGQDASTVVENLAAQLQPILSDIRQITASINNPDGDIQQTLKNLNQVTGKLRGTVDEFTRLGASGNEKLDTAYVKIDRALDNVNAGMEALGKGVPQLMEKADAALDNVQSATTDIRKITSESAGEIPSLVRNTNALVQDGQETLVGVKKSWLLNSLFSKPEEQTLPVDGYVAPTQP
ncbi:MAG: MCE family protein [Gammaproteobacteria bacterium]|nr:MCE family protein [Gammaproteobacteria bacterium]MBU1968701.1 MCE family protein [Gammaproteobacteria bacterium]